MAAQEKMIFMSFHRAVKAKSAIMAVCPEKNRSRVSRGDRTGKCMIGSTSGTKSVGGSSGRRNKHAMRRRIITTNARITRRREKGYEQSETIPRSVPE